MNQDTIHILSTRPLDGELVHDAARQNIIIDTISFIHTEPVEATIDNVADDAYVVFTSMNAVEAVASVNAHWKIFCMGTTTLELVHQHFTNSVVVATADNAGDLADKIIENNVDKVVFFCGDQRRPELPEKLKNNNVRVQEITVYKTIATPVQLKDNYDGILFFSPSAVESFFSVNHDKNAVLFAIGTTTEKAIKKYSTNKVIVAEAPGKQLLLQQAIDHLTSTRKCH